MPTVEVGQVIPNVIETTVYDWKWYYTAQGFAVWLVVILALVIPRSNRDLRALLIFVPLVIVNRVAMPVMGLTGMISGSAVRLDTLLQSMVLGIAVLWLTAGYLERFSGRVRFSLAFGTVALVAGLNSLSYFTQFSEELVFSLALIAFLALALLAAMIPARIMCDRRCRPVDFMVWLAACTLIGSILAVYALSIISNGASPTRFLRSLVKSTSNGLVLGVGLYLVNLPFMILGFAHPFFRKRLHSCLNLKLKVRKQMAPNVKTSE